MIKWLSIDSIFLKLSRKLHGVKWVEPNNGNVNSEINLIVEGIMMKLLSSRPQCFLVKLRSKLSMNSS